MTQAKLIQKVDFKDSNIFIGLDVHKKSWSVTIYHETVFVKNFTQPPNSASLSNYLNSNFPNATYKAVYESGFCGFWIQRELTELGINCIIVNASDVPKTNKTIHNKTDQVDSKRLALALQANMLHPIHVPNKEIESDRILVRYNQTLNKRIISSKNQVKATLNFLGIEIPERFLKGSNWSNVFIKWIEDLPINSSSLKNTISLNIGHVKTLKAQKYQILKAIRGLINDEKYKENAALLMSIPGIGAYTAMVLLTEIDDINRFNSFKKLNGFIGFYPSEYSSGEHIHKGKITNRKHQVLRSLLIEASWVIIRNDPAMTKAYSELKANIGGKRAIVKIARKLLSRINYVLKNKKKYVVGIVE